MAEDREGVQEANPFVPGDRVSRKDGTPGVYRVERVRNDTLVLRREYGEPLIVADGFRHYEKVR